MSEVYVLAARRTAVAPRNGAFRQLEVAQLAAPLITAILNETGLAGHDIDDVILGNALYAGGNPARVISLAAGLPDRMPALTLDTQCCAGLDAILMAASRIRAGEAQAIIAGGVESYSRSPLRARRPASTDEPPAPYARPPFTPWPERDPDLIETAAALARARNITRAAQERFAIDSHAKARAGHGRGEIAPVGGLLSDPFTRNLDERVCTRLPVIAGDAPFGLTTSTVAVEADAAAIVLVVGAGMLDRLRCDHVIRLRAGSRIGLDPAQPALGAQTAARPLLDAAGRSPVAVELMESFASQAIAAIEDLRLHGATVNRSGGALARGHPIGASGAILVVRLFCELRDERPGALGLAAIAAAGGLGSAALFERL